MKVELSKSLDGCIRIGDVVCLLHVPTESVISGHMSALAAQEATELLTDSKVTSSTYTQPCPRNAFIIGRYAPRMYSGCLKVSVTFTPAMALLHNLEMSFYMSNSLLLQHWKALEDRLVFQCTFAGVYNSSCSSCHWRVTEPR